MPLFKFGRKKSAKDGKDKLSPKTQQVQSEPADNIFKQTWWLWAMFGLIFIVMAMTANWSKIEPFWDKFVSIIPH